MNLRILLVGGYGTFGARLVRLLADDGRFAIFVGGRSAAKAHAFCSSIPARAQLVPLLFDRTRDAESQIKAVAPDILIDASGPFQDYGDEPYALVKACLKLHVHYLDFADATLFVGGIAQFEEEARAANVVVLSGASTFPALSTASLRRLVRDLSRVDTVSMGIAPSPRTRIGLNVIRVIAGYAGRRVALWSGEKWATGYALMQPGRVTIAPPGCMPLRPRWFSLIDAPDLLLVPKRSPQVQSVWSGAGTVPALWHRALNALAWLVRLGILPSLSPFAALFHWVGSRLVWGEHRGGMFVRVSGADARGNAVRRTWHMVAEGDDGPFVPSLAACGILRKWIAGAMPTVGARACIDELELSDFESMFAEFRIVSGVRQDSADDASWPLYRRFLGPAWEALPEPIRVMHDGTGTWSAAGRSRVERGGGLIARIVAAVNGFPQAGDDVPISVRFESANGRETWTRNFAGKEFGSVQFEGRGRYDGLICERFGPLTFAMALVLDDGKLRLIQRGWSVFGVALPMFLAPQGDTWESAEDGRFHFHVEIGFPWTGLVVAYRGWLARI